MTTTALNLTAARVRPAGPHRARFNTAMDLVVKRYEHNVKLLSHAESDDHRLRWLWTRANDVGRDVNDLLLGELKELATHNLQDDLAGLVALTLAWLAGAGVRHSENKIWGERERQRELFRASKISFDVANAIVDPARKFRVLAEEVGEVAHAIDQIENHGMAAGNLHLELVQVAAVAVAWLESLETINTPKHYDQNN